MNIHAPLRAPFRAAIILALCAGAAAQEPVRFDGHRAIRVTARTARELMTIRSLADEVLTCEGSGIGSFDIRLSPERFAALTASGIPYTVTIPDLQAHFDSIRAQDAAVRAGDDPAWFATYRTLAEIESQMQLFAATYPALAAFSNVSTSVQNRQIRMLRITGPGSTAARPAFVIQANQHAREWVTPMCAMYIVDRFLETYATDSRIRNIVDHVDFYIIPSVNPDGYEYSRLTNPDWRKNRRDNPGTSCDGIDLNRNWGFQWGFDNVGSSGNTCSETYRGPAAWSEPEIAGIKSLVDSLQAQGRLRVHWDIHSNGQMILSPWGYTVNPPAQLPLMNTLGQLIQAGMTSIRGTPYPYGQGAVILYLANGNTRDYTYGAHGRMAWTIEMGGNSFMPPVSEILPLAQEALAGLLPLAEQFIVPDSCYANCDGSTSVPALTVGDFACFLNAFAAGSSYANCDGSTAIPTLTVADFSCFLNRFAAGCN